jgi:hypothetical protein
MNQMNFLVETFRLSRGWLAFNAIGMAGYGWLEIRSFPQDTIVSSSEVIGNSLAFGATLIPVAFVNGIWLICALGIKDWRNRRTAASILAVLALWAIFLALQSYFYECVAFVE